MLSRLNSITAKTSLSVRFFVSGLLVMLVAAYVLGSWVSRQIEAGVTENYGVASALYFESLVPQLPFLQGTVDELPDDAKAELRSVFVDGVLRDQVVTYKVWAEDGTILASFNPLLEDRRFAISEALERAWEGEVAAEYQEAQLRDPDAGASIALPLLGVYVPIRNVASGEVVTVIEFYQRAEDLLEDIEAARRQTWYIVSAVFLVSGALLFGIVHAGSRLIGRQQTGLQQQLRENEELQQGVAAAATRSTSQADRVMQRIGLDLHDGVAQHLALLALRLDGAGLKDPEDSATIRDALANAMTELRAISRGLALPDIDALSPADTIKRAVTDHNKAFGANVGFADPENTILEAGTPAKLALYRVTQELLANTHKHAKAEHTTVTFTQSGSDLIVTVRDDGIGFDADASSLQDISGQGLIGVRDRLLPLGGRMDIQSQPDYGTTVVVTLPIKGVDE